MQLTQHCTPETITEDQRKPSLFELLGESAALLWKEWPMDMVAKSLPPPQGLFSLRGTCPHHGDPSTFTIVSGHTQGMPAIHLGDSGVGWAIMQCQGCLGFILGCAGRLHNQAWKYITHFPVGKPDDRVPEEIPENISADFKEAIRCRSLDCYRATLLMCRRSIETSCRDLGATGNNLMAKIDDLAANGKIADGLKDLAHHVRLEGNEGAHGAVDDLSPARVDAVVSFSREYLNYVYVMPEQLRKIREQAGT